MLDEIGGALGGAADAVVGAVGDVTDAIFGAGARAKLQALTPPGIVEFDFNPDSIRVQRTSQMMTRPNAGPNAGSPGGSSPSIFKKAAPANIMLRKVIFHGPDTKPRCDLLLKWMSPGGGGLFALAGAALSAATGGAINLVSRPPVVNFVWGGLEKAFFHLVMIQNVTINYTRFTPTGMPIRAEVDIRMQEQPSFLDLLPTNPTSGGLPGRRAHTVTDGESLAGIARRQYGSPSRWREIAEVNDIEDPLRMRAGDRVYLPNPNELRGGR